METTLVTALPLWALDLFLAGMVYFRHPQKGPNQAFAVFVLLVVGWSFCVNMFYGSTAHLSGLLWGRLAFAAASLIGSSFAAFCQIFPDRQNPSLHKVSYLSILLGVLLAGLSLTPLVLCDVVISGAGGLQRHYGPLYEVYAASLLAAFGQGIWTLTGKWRIARGRTRLQIQYLWLGLCMALCGGTITNLIIPALVQSSGTSAYGPYFSVFLVGLTAHAIIRHRLMDIRVVIRQSVTYVLSAGVGVGIIWGLFAVMSKGFGLQLTLSSPTLPLIIGLVGVAVFHPARVVIQRLFDKYCYRPAYDYRHTLKMISQVLARLLRIDPLCEHLTSFILTTLKVEEVAVYLYHDQCRLEQRFYQHVSTPQPIKAECIAMASADLMRLLARASNPILQDELARWANAPEVEQLHAEFTRLRGKVIIPLLVEHQVAGCIAVGEKLSGDPFFTHDLEFLATIGHQAGVALKRAQLHEEVTWMKEYNDNILRHMESGLVVSDHDGMITVVNEAAARMLGLSAAEIVGQPVEQLIPYGLGMALLATLMKKTVYTNHEATLTGASGQLLPIVLSTSILRGEDDQAGGAILAINDLSHIKALEEEKRRIERLASIGAFMSGIAHEIKNPLVAIKTLAELLPEQYDDEEFRDTFTKVTLSEVNRIDTLVRRLRSLSSGSAVPLHSMTIITPLEETLSLISGELIRRKISLTREYQDPLPHIMGDHDQLKQVFVNLCLNGIEAMGEGGTLKVTVGSIDNHAGQPAELIIQIADTGPGIPAEHLTHIFDPFFTLKDEGTGLGLAICRGILDHHRGAISAANNAEGSGAIFTLKLPVAQGVDAYEIAATCH